MYVYVSVCVYIILTILDVPYYPLSHTHIHTGGSLLLVLRLEAGPGGEERAPEVI